MIGRPRLVAGLTVAALLSIALPTVVGGSRPGPAGLSQTQYPTVFRGHPRLIVGGYRGVTIDELRRACASAKLKPQCDQLGGRHILDDAMRYLVFDDDAAAARVVTRLNELPECSALGDTYERTTVGGYAIAFDWVHDTIADPAPIERKLGQCGRYIASDGLKTNSPHLWHGYTSQAAALALAALAVDDGYPERDELLQEAATLFRDTALEAYEVVGGAWPEGYSYERTHFFSGDPPYQYVIDALRAWDSAVERDHPSHESLFETIEQEEGDWLRGLGYHLVYGTIPAYHDGGKATLLRGGDMPTGQAYPNKQYRPFVDSIARVYGDPVLAAWGQALERDWAFVGGTGTYHSIHRYSLPYNLPPASSDPAPEPPALGRMWARDDLGYAISRSGWDDDDAIVGFRAGKWFTGHQHSDQGHIDIWRSGPLAVDSGVYAGWGSEHREAYYIRSAAHNTVLIPKAGEQFIEHPKSGVDVNDGGQRIYTYSGCAQCMQSVAEWRSNIGDRLHFEGGSIDAFEDEPGYTVIRSDITASYNSTNYSTPGNEPKVDSVQRDVTFLRPDVLVVLDRISTVGGAGPPRFVLHLPARPDLIEPQVVQGEADNGILESAAPTFVMDNGSGGRLHVQSLGGTRLRAVGGPDYRYWLDSANRVSGSDGLEGPPAEPGVWRIESIHEPQGAPGRPEGDALLAHVLTITDTGGSAVPASSEPTTPDSASPAPAMAIRVAYDEWPVFLVGSASIPRRRVPFVFFFLGGGKPASILLTDLEPGARYRAAVDGAVVADGPSSIEGVLPFIVTSEAIQPGGSTLVVARCPANEGAGTDWRSLCGEIQPPTATSVATLAPGSTATATVRPGPTPTNHSHLWLPRLEIGP